MTQSLLKWHHCRQQNSNLRLFFCLFLCCWWCCFVVFRFVLLRFVFLFCCCFPFVCFFLFFSGFCFRSLPRRFYIIRSERSVQTAENKQASHQRQMTGEIIQWILSAFNRCPHGSSRMQCKTIDKYSCLFVSGIDFVHRERTDFISTCSTIYWTSVRPFCLDVPDCGQELPDETLMTPLGTEVQPRGAVPGISCQQ